MAEIKKRIFIFWFIASWTILLKAQFTYGTTGLLNMPTADMQRDKTLLFGGSFLEKHTFRLNVPKLYLL